MSLRFCVLPISALCVTAGLAASPAYAQARVGEAAVVKNEVVRVVGPATSQISVGDGVLRDEIVRTRSRQRGPAGDGRQHQPVARSQCDDQT